MIVNWRWRQLHHDVAKLDEGLSVKHRGAHCLDSGRRLKAGL